MARRGRDQITVRLEDEVLEELRPLVSTERGRAGGLSFYLRRLIYQDLGKPLPEQYGREAELASSPSLTSRLQRWVDSDPDVQGELVEAARLLAERAGLELLKSEEVARLRESAAEADRLRKKLKSAPAPPPILGSEYQEGRYAGLQQGARMAEELIGIHREGRGERAKGICEGLRTAADFCRTVMTEIEETREREQDSSKRGRTRGTRYAEPAYIRSVAKQWQLVLRQDPEDKRAREALAELEAVARAAGFEIPPLPPTRSRGRTGR